MRIIDRKRRLLALLLPLALLLAVLAGCGSPAAAQSLVDIVEDKGDFEPIRIGARVKWRRTTKKRS